MREHREKRVQCWNGGEFVDHDSIYQLLIILERNSPSHSNFIQYKISFRWYVNLVIKIKREQAKTYETIPRQHTFGDKISWTYEQIILNHWQLIADRNE